MLYGEKGGEHANMLAMEYEQKAKTILESIPFHGKSTSIHHRTNECNSIVKNK